MKIALVAVVILQPLGITTAQPAQATDGLTLDLLADLNPTSGASWPGDVVLAGAKYYFTAHLELKPDSAWLSSSYVTRLYVTDGVAGGLTSEIFTYDSDYGYDSTLVPIPGTNSIVFYGAAPGEGLRLYVSDGTRDGTVPLKLSPTDSDSSGFYYARNLQATKDKGVVFVGDYCKWVEGQCDISDYRYTDTLPWRVTSGPVVTDLKKGFVYPVPCWQEWQEDGSVELCERGIMLDSLMVTANVLYGALTTCDYDTCLSANPYHELYKLDLNATNPAWVLVKDLSPGLLHGTWAFHQVASTDTQLWFNASATGKTGDSYRLSLYTTNGTSSGTKRQYYVESTWLPDGTVWPDQAVISPTSPPTVYFRPAGSLGLVMKTTPAATSSTQVARCGYPATYPVSPVVLGTTVYFPCARDLDSVNWFVPGSEVLWKYTGTGTASQLYDPKSGLGLYPHDDLLTYNGTLYFIANDFSGESMGFPTQKTALFSFTPGVDTVPVARITDEAGYGFAIRTAGSKLFAWIWSEETGVEPYIVTPPAVPVVLTVTKAPLTGPTGPTGTITSDPAGISCPPTCWAPFNQYSTVTLTANAATGSVFSSWSGACTGTANTCSVSMTAAKAVTGTFGLAYKLTVTKAGTGTGTVSSSPSGISCGATCDKWYPSGTNVTLTASADTGSKFTGWSACTGTATCAVAMSAAKTVTATFQPLYDLAVTKSGSGSGTVTSNPTGVSCGSTCTFSFVASTPVVLTAAAPTGNTFAGWSGACSGTATTCTVSMSSAKSVTATFNIQTFNATVTRSGTGSGAVTSSPSGISCGSTCTYAFNYNTSVTLTATPATGSLFGGWSGACTGTGSCSLAMTAVKAVGAVFTLQKFRLTATRTGNGTGTVTSAPTGINCGTVCLFDYDYNTSVTLTATPLLGSSFTGWSGACSGTGTCTVSMTLARTATATFTLNTYSLTVTKSGSGSGTVTSNPTGVSCGSTCTYSFNHGTVVTLTSTRTSPSTFAGWSGACTGVATTCAITMTGTRAVTATFDPPLYAVTVTKAGPGTVTSSPTGLNCGTACAYSWFSSTAVTLTATATTGGTFLSWSGGTCSGTASTCSFTLNGAKAVTATFGFNVALSKTPAAGGTVTSSVAGINCGISCSSQTAAYASGNVTLTATPASGYSFAGWTGSCTGTSTCVLAMTAAKAVAATFKLILTVSKNVAAAASIISTPTALTCATTQTTCTAAFTASTVVTLTATTVLPYTSVSWSNCTPVFGFPKKCTVTVDEPKTVTATFS